jgi:ABC-type multidrug transport system fused ATPase/permease subunit
VVLRQALVVAGGYSLVWALRLCLRHTSVPEWIFVLAFLTFDAGYLTFDLTLNYLFSSRISYPLFGRLRTGALEHILRMPLEWHQRQTSGALTGRVNNGVGKVVQTVEGVSRELIPSVVQTLFSLVPLLLISPATMPPVLLALGIFMWLTVREHGQRKPLARARYADYNRDFEYFSETMQAVQPVVQYGQQSRVLGRYDRVQRRIASRGLEEARIGNRFGFSRNMVLAVARRVCQGVWIWQYRHNAIDAAMILYLNMLTEQLLASFGGYASLVERLYDGLAPTRSLVNLFREKPTIADAPGVERLEVPERIGIRLNGVRFAYPGRGRMVLRDFNLEVEPGTVLGIVGRSGGGKTTMQNLLGRTFDVQHGSVQVGGHDVRRWPLEQLRGLFSTVSQNGGVFFTGMRIADIVRLPRPDASLREVVQAAQAACIHHEICSLPQKYRTRIGQGGVTFSKGQQQRIALAQALIALQGDRRVLVLDEFTSALDSETEERILHNIRPLLEGRTVIIIAHRLSTIRKLAGRIVVLDRTGIAEEGTHDELIDAGGWYSGMARLQASGGPAEAPGRLVRLARAG